MIGAGQRKIYALKLTIGALMAIVVLYVFCLILKLDVDGTTFGTFAGVVGVGMGGFSWANGQEHKKR